MSVMQQQDQQQQQQQQTHKYIPRDPNLRDLHQVEQDIFNTCEFLKTLKQNKTEAWVNECITSQSAFQQNQMYPKFDKNINYYQEFWRTYLLNEMMISKIQDFTGENKHLSQKINDLDNLHKEYHKIQAARNKKKNRRTAQEIEKSFTCPYTDCVKIYGSEVSLNLHIKLKHNGGNKTERERLARSILIAQENGDPNPDQILNFPPGYLEKYREQFLKEKEKGIPIDQIGQNLLDNVDNDDIEEEDDFDDDELDDTSSINQDMHSHNLNEDTE